MTDLIRIDETHRVKFFNLYQQSQIFTTEPFKSSQRVIIEYMTYNEAWESQSDKEKVLKVAALIGLLNCFKSAGFHVLNCIGVIPPTVEDLYKAFGFVYALPSYINGEQNLAVKILFQILESKRHTPLLEQKFSFAKCLASSIWQLHSAGWLHENISSNNLMFFIQVSESIPETIGLKNNMHLMGFYHSRFDQEIWVSNFDRNDWTPYQHPSFVFKKTRFQKIYDYYSVNIVLFEIGFWEPISAL